MKNTHIGTPQPIGRFIDPLTDFGFKRIFGSELNKDLLIAFLNELFKGRKVICDLVYNPQENNGPGKHYRKTIFDLTCTGEDGETFIIEVQRAEQDFFVDRAIYYTSGKLYEQGPKGDKTWSYELKEVYFIGLMDFKLDNAPSDKYLHWVRLAEEERNETFYKKLGFIFLELPNFNLKRNEIKTSLECWLYALRNMGDFKKIPVILHGKIFQKLFQVSEVANLTKQEYMLYERKMKEKWDRYAVLKTAKRKAMESGMQKGIEKGIEKGIKKGIEQGIEQGIKKGIETGKEQFVRNLLSNTQFKIPAIATLAGVTESFVKKIQKQATHSKAPIKQ
ncbi:Rpn family recombination-promoting nuclease/putative transposase [Niabella hirudinis]|uniref:Rpn family recombination-promoting nuclease/putative transposase n=1 Tax=Niabella hirudinis TaxID=1285929 RepID=UPI003EC0F67E